MNCFVPLITRNLLRRVVFVARVGSAGFVVKSAMVLPGPWDHPFLLLFFSAENIEFWATRWSSHRSNPRGCCRPLAISSMQRCMPQSRASAILRGEGNAIMPSSAICFMMCRDILRGSVVGPWRQTHPNLRVIFLIICCFRIENPCLFLSGLTTLTKVRPIFSVIHPFLAHFDCSRDWKTNNISPGK